MLDLKNKIRIGLVVLGLLLVYFIQRGCDTPTVQKIRVPEKKGNFTAPPQITEKKGKKDSIVYVKGKTIYTENPFNKKLAEDFIASQKENDSLKALKLYLDAIQEKDGTYVFNNKDLKLEIITKTRGEILSIKPTYTIKEYEVKTEVKQKETVFAIYTGAALETTSDLNKLVPKAIIGIQNKSGNIISAEIGTDKSIQIGISFRILNIKN